MYEIVFAESYFKFWKNISLDTRSKIIKKIELLKTDKKFRHLRSGLPYFVQEVGQYRVCFLEKDNTRILIFVGNHKEYEKWYLSKM